MDSLVAAAVFGRRRRRGSHGKPAFDPRTLPGLAFWYHPAAADVVKDDATGKVSRLIDLSGSGNDATQFTGANQFTWGATTLNGGPGLSGTTASSMTGPVVDLSAGFLYTTWVDPGSFSIAPIFAKIDDGTAARRLWIFFSTTGQVCVRVYQDTTIELGRRTAANYAALNVPILVSVAWNGQPSSAGLHIFVNGVQADTLTENSGTFTGLTPTTLPIKIGSMAGVGGDALLCTQPVPDVDRQALESAFLGNTPLYLPPPPPSQFAGNIYVSPTGTATAEGTLADPIDFQTILNVGVQPGTTIWMRGGTYPLDAVVNFAGATGNMTWIRAYMSGSFGNERVTIDGSYMSNGAYIGIRDLEIMYSETTRTTQQSGSDPTDVPRQGRTTYINAPNNKVINCYLHDLGDGFFAGAKADGLELHGTHSWDNGWDAPDRGHGHAYYQQNNTSPRNVTCNVAFNGFESGYKCSGTGDADVRHFFLQGNDAFECGVNSALHGRTFCIHLDHTGNITDNTIDRNNFFHIPGLQPTVKLDDPLASPPAQNTTFTNNILQGVSVSFNDGEGYVSTGNKITSGADPLNDGQTTLIGLRIPNGYDHALNTVDSNTYATPGGAGTKNPFFYVENGAGAVYDFAGWQGATGYDANSTFVQGQFTGADIRVEKNLYEAGRAKITCWNWDLASSLTVDPADLVGILSNGDSYEVRHVYDLFGAAVVSGTYDGTGIVLPQTGYTAPIPIGLSTAPASTAPKFNVFLVRKVA